MQQANPRGCSMVRFDSCVHPVLWCMQVMCRMEEPQLVMRISLLKFSLKIKRDRERESPTKPVSKFTSLGKEFAEREEVVDKATEYLQVKSSSVNAFVIKTGSTTQWQADLAPKEMAASDLRNRRHVQLLLTWSTDAAHLVSLDQQDDSLIMASLLGAVEDGSVDVVEELLARHTVDLNYCNKLGETALHVAAGLGHLELVRLFHSRGAHLLQTDENQENAVFWAARNGHTHVIQYLVEEGVPLNLSNSNSEADEELPNDDSEFYFGKDGVTKWKKTMWQKTQIRTRSTNIISQLPGPKSEAKSIESESDAFTKIIDNDMVQKIVDCTNAYISNIKEHFSRERDAKLTTVTEILALFGLLIMSGVKRAAHLTYKELWAVDGSGVEIVRAIMSQDRFLFLLRCLRFDYITTRKERKKLDKLAPIREFVEAFVYNCKKLYTPGEYNTIDEKLIPFRGRCGFRQYMPNKPAKYGLKIYTISDARTFYTFNFEIYCGKQPDGPYKKSNSPDDIVKRLITPISGTSRNITTDNWYTSYKLSQDLLTEHKLTLVGTLKKNKKEIPKIFLPNRNRPKYNSIFGFTQNTTLVSYVPKKSKAVLLLSTMHSTPTIDEESGFKLKPEIVTFYNLTKGGVDMVNQMCGTYSVGRRTNRWPLCLFFDLLNVAGINSEIIFKSLNINSPRVPRRIFLKNISLQLFQDHLKIRSQLKNLPRSLHDLIILHCKKAESPEIEMSVESEPKKRKRCYVCPSTKGSTTQIICYKCRRHICQRHSLNICKDCE
ncbi:hypothetical protein LAZ67_5003798 [Cordylochernes scorpioides]|uniref:PiggyBac transposable element-derived protein domain-containing protein n=1 Tax=Cordylochernes scorpioides TaxID=51811 RepID=A0ABY6KIK2_9ARAC|nr:hypothetical protein LAZ67_5003798 [Cordylochernes scorpioides]